MDVPHVFSPFLKKPMASYTAILRSTSRPPKPIGIRPAARIEVQRLGKNHQMRKFTKRWRVFSWFGSWKWGSNDEHIIWRYNQQYVVYENLEVSKVMGGLPHPSHGWPWLCIETHVAMTSSEVCVILANTLAWEFQWSRQLLYVATEDATLMYQPTSMFPTGWDDDPDSSSGNQIIQQNSHFW